MCSESPPPQTSASLGLASGVLEHLEVLQAQQNDWPVGAISRRPSVSPLRMRPRLLYKYFSQVVYTPRIFHTVKLRFIDQRPAFISINFLQTFKRTSHNPATNMLQCTRNPQLHTNFFHPRSCRRWGTTALQQLFIRSNAEFELSLAVNAASPASLSSQELSQCSHERIVFVVEICFSHSWN